MHDGDKDYSLPGMLNVHALLQGHVACFRTENLADEVPQIFLLYISP